MNAVVELPVFGEALGVGPDGQLVVATSALAFAVDPSSGAVTPAALRPSAPGARRDDPALVLPARSLRLALVETAGGPVSRISRADGAEVAACAGRDFVVVTGAYTCTLHMFSASQGFLSRVTVARPEPEGSPGSALLLGAAVWVLAGKTLARIDLASLPRGTDVALAATFDPLVPPARESTETAKVAFALATGSVGLDHPRLGRLVMTRRPEDTALARGDEVVLDDVVEELPGVWRVRSWHKKGASRSQRPAPAPIVLEAPRVSSVLVDPGAADTAAHDRRRRTGHGGGLRDRCPRDRAGRRRGDHEHRRDRHALRGLLGGSRDRGHRPSGRRHGAGRSARDGGTIDVAITAGAAARTGDRAIRVRASAEGKVRETSVSLLVAGKPGDIDTSFADNGILPPKQVGKPGPLAVGPDGQLYLGLVVGAGAGVARFSPDGRPDTAVGTCGTATFAFGGPGSTSTGAAGLAVLGDGSLLVAGASSGRAC